MKPLLSSIVLLTALGLGGCALFNDKDNGPRPLKVPEFKATAELDEAASFGVDKAEGAIFEPLWLKGRIAATGKDGKVKLRSPQGDLSELTFPASLGAGLDGNGELLLAAGSKGRIMALGKDGRLVWSHDAKSEILARPRLAGDTVFVRTQDGRLLALSSADGTLRWQSEVKNPPLVLHVPTGMAIGDAAVYAAFPGGRLRAHARTDGKLLWETWVAQPKGASELERITDVVGDPWLDGGQVCAASYQGKIACLDAEKGETRWSRDFSSASGLTGDHRHVYATDASSKVLAFDKATGREIWKQDRLHGRKVTRPTVFGRYVAVADYEGKVYLLDAENGQFAAIADVGDAVTAPLQLADEGLLAQDEDGEVTLLRLR